ncbi:hypothetical protein ACFL5V_00375 [Fibrobacterota bacterium]
MSVLALLLAPLWSPASAHTFPVREIDHFSDIRISDTKTSLAYGVSMTEIQAVLLYFQMNLNNDSYISPQEKFAFLSGSSDEIMQGLELHLDGTRLELVNTRTFKMIRPYGMIYFFEHVFEELSPGQHTLVFLDKNDGEIPGKESFRFHREENIILGDRTTSWRKAEISFLSQTEKFTAAEKLPAAEHEQTGDAAGVKAAMLARALELPGRGQASLVTNESALSGPEQRAIQQGENSFSWGPGSPPERLPEDSSQYARVKLKIQNALQGRLTLFIVISTLVLAFFIGALHALQPGHGKTLVAAYLVGSRGTIWHAILLGLVVTFTHTFSVIMLGLVVLFLSQYILPETVNMWLGIITGALIVIMGVWLFLQAYKRVILEKHSGAGAPQEEHSHTHFGIRHSHLPGPGTGRPHESDEKGHEHAHEHGDHHEHRGEHEHRPGHSHPHALSHHAHEHGHHHGHHQDEAHHEHEHHPEHHHIPGHEHATAQAKHGSAAAVRADRDRQPISLWNLLTLGIVGGIVPCPDAIVLLLIAAAINRIVFGLLIIVVFSAGIAAVLIAIGIMMVSAKDLLNKFDKGARFLARMPIISALLITLIGLVMLFQALVNASLISF